LGGCPLLHGYRVPARSKPHRIRRALARAAAPGRALARSSRIRDRVAPSPPLERTSRPALASDRLQPRFHGPGAGRLSPPGTSRCDSSRRELRPNPIGSDTSCRELVAPRLEADDTGSRRTCWKARVTGPVTSPPREPAFAMPATAPTRPAHAGPPGQEKTARAAFPPAQMGARLRGHHPGPRAASPDPPRRGPRSAAPEVPSIHGLPRPGQDVLHSLSPTCGKPPAPF